MSNGKASTKAKNKYRDNNYDRLELAIPKGKKGAIKEHADKRSESVTSFVVRAIDETIERDSKQLE